LVEVKVSEPLLLRLAVRPTPAAESALLRLSIELTSPAAVPKVIVTFCAAFADTSNWILPASEFAVPEPELVRSVEEPAVPAAGAALVMLAFVE